MSDFDCLPLFSFDLAVVDPPWNFKLYSEKGEEKSAQAQYACMDLADIKALRVGELMRMHSWLLLWATAPLLPQALEVMTAWGFSYCTTIAWRKLYPSGKPRRGCGYVARTMHENVLIGSLGSPQRGKPLDSLFDGVAREHSRKPDEFYSNVEAFAPNANKLDLFSRENRKNWTSWGFERGKFNA